MVHSGAHWNDVLKLEQLRIFEMAIDEMMFWNWLEKFEIMDDKCCILTLFEMMFLKFNLLGKNWKHGEKMMRYYDAIWNDVLEVGNAQKKLKATGNVVHSNTI